MKERPSVLLRSWPTYHWAVKPTTFTVLVMWEKWTPIVWLGVLLLAEDNLTDTLDIVVNITDKKIKNNLTRLKYLLQIKKYIIEFK